MIEEVGKVTARAKKRIDPQEYGRLLAETLPRPISAGAEYERTLEIIDRLMSRSETSLTAEEHVLLELMTQLVERYEEDIYQIPEAPPHVMIQGLMRDRELRNRDLEPILGSSGVTSEIISGKRKPSKIKSKPCHSISVYLRSSSFHRTKVHEERSRFSRAVYFR
jgi:HTH-type transcriptional regulator/antitoxin HigA